MFTEGLVTLSVAEVSSGCSVDLVTEHGRREQDSHSPSSVRVVLCSS